jgi:hypothetical protein
LPSPELKEVLHKKTLVVNYFRFQPVRVGEVIVGQAFQPACLEMPIMAGGKACPTLYDSVRARFLRLCGRRELNQSEPELSETFQSLSKLVHINGFGDETIGL